MPRAHELAWRQRSCRIALKNDEAPNLRTNGVLKCSCFTRDQARSYASPSHGFDLHIDRVRQQLLGCLGLRLGDASGVPQNEVAAADDREGDRLLATAYFRAVLEPWPAFLLSEPSLRATAVSLVEFGVDTLGDDRKQRSACPALGELGANVGAAVGEIGRVHAASPIDAVSLRPAARVGRLASSHSRLAAAANF